MLRQEQNQNALKNLDDEQQRCRVLLFTKKLSYEGRWSETFGDYKDVYIEAPTNEADFPATHGKMPETLDYFSKSQKEPLLLGSDNRCTHASLRQQDEDKTRWLFSGTCFINMNIPESLEKSGANKRTNLVTQSDIVVSTTVQEGRWIQQTINKATNNIRLMYEESSTPTTSLWSWVCQGSDRWLGQTWS